MAEKKTYASGEEISAADAERLAFMEANPEDRVESSNSTPRRKASLEAAAKAKYMADYKRRIEAQKKGAAEQEFRKRQAVRAKGDLPQYAAQEAAGLGDDAGFERWANQNLLGSHEVSYEPGQIGELLLKLGEDLGPEAFEKAVASLITHGLPSHPDDDLTAMTLGYPEVKHSEERNPTYAWAHLVSELNRRGGS